MTSQPEFSPSCPYGGQWYACGNGTRFYGCCAGNPCTNTGCPAGLLYAATFDETKHGTFIDQGCSAGLFYTCTANVGFLGCCKVNPCSNDAVCPVDQLAPGILSSEPALSNQYDPQPPLPGQESTSSGLPATTSSSKSASQASSGTAAAATASNSSQALPSSVPVGAIAGGAAGGFAALVAIVALVWWFRHHSRQSNKYHRRGTGDRGNGPCNQDTAYTSNESGKAATVGVMKQHSPYLDSPAAVPPYSSLHSPAPRYPSHGYNPQMQQHDYDCHPQAQEVANNSMFKAYPPQSAGNYPPYGTPHLSPPLSSSHGHSQSWSNSSVTDLTRAPVAPQYGGAQFARVYQGHPQEMAGCRDDQLIGLGVHHVVQQNTAQRLVAELDTRTRSPT